MVLWSKPSEYLLSQLRSLHALGVEIDLFAQNSGLDAPYDLQEKFSYLRSFNYIDEIDSSKLMQLIREKHPDAFLICSWNNLRYLRIARRFRLTRILFMDNQWHGTLKQILGVCFRRFIIKPHFDGVLLPGERQEKFAKFLGFKSYQIAKKGYSADVEKFASCNPRAHYRKFLYVGRLVEEKGIRDLLNGYITYQKAVDDPWGLQIIGNGYLKDAILNNKIPGVEVEDFVQPSQLIARYCSASCFVLASKFEPWGLVLHEAAACGLPIICSDACGSSDEFVVNGTNGLIFSAGNDFELSEAMVKIHEMNQSQWENMSMVSRSLSTRITPDIWAKSLINLLTEIQTRRLHA